MCELLYILRHPKVRKHQQCYADLPRNISAKMQPTLHTSTGLLYEEWSRTSGALYHCVTTCSEERERECVVCVLNQCKDVWMSRHGDMCGRKYKK